MPFRKFLSIFVLNAIVTVFLPVPVGAFPPAVSCNLPGVVVTIQGTGFMPTSFVRVNGVGQDIEVVGRSEIKTTLDCKELNIPGTSSLVVVNPEPINEGDSDVSNVVKFLVTQ